ncbi:hypothetical protein KCX83_04210 [Brucella oryzae]|uniref:hypothetical protein n=1 Tax=Brucella oryzae TaxID=335286 RepID=UPI001B8154D0|nr:hypothetical protein [Brucella oryzae]MBR7651523.1 hypothetical protein [Brucella oryzae]
METLRQADIARELVTTDMQISRICKALHISGQPMTDMNAVLIFASYELQLIGVQPSRSCELVARFQGEIRYASSPDSRAWLIFIEDDVRDVILTALTARRLESILTAHPLSIVLPLHEVAQRGAERLEIMKRRLARRTAA